MIRRPAKLGILPTSCTFSQFLSMVPTENPTGSFEATDPVNVSWTSNKEVTSKSCTKVNQCFWSTYNLQPSEWLTCYQGPNDLKTKRPQNLLPTLWILLLPLQRPPKERWDWLGETNLTSTHTSSFDPCRCSRTHCGGNFYFLRHAVKINAKEGDGERRSIEHIFKDGNKTLLQNCQSKLQ